MKLKYSWELKITKNSTIDESKNIRSLEPHPITRLYALPVKRLCHLDIHIKPLQFHLTKRISIFDEKVLDKWWQVYFEIIVAIKPFRV